jgi:regulator of RNase E activity RraB
MPAPWEPSFDVYMSDVDGAITSFVIDMAAAEHAPLATHPIRVQVRVELLRPLPNGLRDQSELEPMGKVEDTLVERLETALDAIYVGRFLGEGASNFVFYLPESARDALADLEPVIGSLGEYEPEWLDDEDPEWGFYMEFLYPDAESHERMMNRAQLTQRREIGDRLDVPREIDHFATFPSEEQAAAAGVALKGAGFRVDEPSEGEDGETWGFEFHRDETLTDDRPDEFCAEIRDLIEPHEGEYDGWGGMVVKADALGRGSPHPRPLSPSLPERERGG